jgi:hypothetical protein
MVLHSNNLFYVQEGFSMNTQAELEEIEYILSEEAYTKWLYENNVICNGDMLVNLLEDGDLPLRYLDEHGLPSDSEIKGITS